MIADIPGQGLRKNAFHQARSCWWNAGLINAIVGQMLFLSVNPLYVVG